MEWRPPCVGWTLDAGGWLEVGGMMRELGAWNRHARGLAQVIGRQLAVGRESGWTCGPAEAQFRLPGSTLRRCCPPSVPVSCACALRQPLAAADLEPLRLARAQKPPTPRRDTRLPPNPTAEHTHLTACFPGACRFCQHVHATTGHDYGHGPCAQEDLEAHRLRSATRRRHYRALRWC